MQSLNSYIRKICNYIEEEEDENVFIIFYASTYFLRNKRYYIQ
jgi:hypothetical protein